MHFPKDDTIIVADVLPHAETTFGEDEQDQALSSLQAWLRVESDGSIAFYREVLDGKVECTGFMPNKALPNWASEYHAAVHFQTSTLSSQTLVHITYVGQELPPSLAQFSYSEIAARWQVQDE